MDTLPHVISTSLTMSNYLFVDCGYLVFYRIYATKCWYKKAHTYTTDEAMVEDPVFFDTYRKRCLDCIKQLHKKYDSNWQHTFFALEGKHLDLWRRSKAPVYKDHRSCPSFVGQAFQLWTEILQGHALQESHQFHLPNGKTTLCYYQNSALEADDIIALMVKYMKQQEGIPKMYILASDQDYLQICCEQVRLVRLDNRDAMKHSSGDPEKDLKLKCILGDPSDGHPPCFPRCGKKTALQLIENPDKLQKFFGTYPGSQDQYNLNRQLISFEYIPTHLEQDLKSVLGLD